MQEQYNKGSRSNRSERIGAVEVDVSGPPPGALAPPTKTAGGGGGGRGRGAPDRGGEAGGRGERGRGRGGRGRCGRAQSAGRRFIAGVSPQAQDMCARPHSCCKHLTTTCCQLRRALPPVQANIALRERHAAVVHGRDGGGRDRGEREFGRTLPLPQPSQQGRPSPTPSPAPQVRFAPALAPPHHISPPCHVRRPLCCVV